MRWDSRRVGEDVATLALIGNYLTSTFTASSDGHGGTFITDPPATVSNQNPTLSQPHA
jgi:hypothetical protein